ncbi:alpha-ketoacid dehydrogenase subunit beta, partial [Bordetella hinzii]|nr:alpha-ketoacid dehydrogenase subunit beta [Bordetella hinzii]
MAQAISEAIGQEMERDERVFVMGEDIGKYGGIFSATTGLLDRFGKDRVMDTPISETAFMG